MVDVRRAIVFSVTATVLLSVPVASQQIDIQDTSEGFNAFVDTDFSTKFRLNITEGLERMKIVDSESRYSFTERPSKQSEKFVTSKGVLKIKRTPNISLRVVETPYGTLKTGYRNGENISEFSGPDRLRPRVAEISRSLMDNMSVSSREAAARRRSVIEEMLPEVEISSDYSSDILNVSNRAEKTISLSGWHVVKAGETESPYPLELGFELRPGETRTLEVGVDMDDRLVLENGWGRKVDFAR